MHGILLIVLLVVALGLVGVILLQQGKGAGMGASFGAGASGTVFGAPGSGNVLTKITTVLAILFFATALGLGYLSTGKSTKKDDIFSAQAAVEEQVATDDIPVAAKTENAAEKKSEEIPAAVKVDADDIPVNKDEVKQDSTEKKEEATKEDDK